jgi:hypothetical protein
MFPRSLAPTSDRREPRRRAYQERQGTAGYDPNRKEASADLDQSGGGPDQP